MTTGLFESPRLAATALVAGMLRARYAEFVEEDHPRDDLGKFSEKGEAGMTVKKKAAPATKEQIAKAIELKKAGHSYAHIEKQTGLNPKQAATIVFKANKQEKELAAKLAEKQVPIAAPVTKAAPVIEAPVGVHPPGYDWQEKTTGPSAGKYAYFDKSGTQVSAPFDKGDYAKAIETMHYGKGPKTPEQQAASKKAADEIANPVAHGVDVESGAGTPGKPWPISNSVSRALGASTPSVLAMTSQEWSGKLTSLEVSAIKNYTGSGYSEINAGLRKGQTSLLTSRIDSALAKAPTPPPPDLVWRGVSHAGVQNIISKLAAGDVITLKGFQSTSINPAFAHSWGGAKTLFEIRPARGAYVRLISSHKAEYEYLLPHGAKYTVRGVAKVPIQGGNHANVIQLEMHK
jgi:hypothetical protein